LLELERHDPGVRLRDDIEDLHRFRVATRRSRAIIRATRPLLGDTLKALGEELTWLTGVLGPARDLDVLLERLRAGARTLEADEPGAGLIIATLEEERERLHDAVLYALADERYFRLLDTFGASIASLPDLDTPGGLRPLAAAELRKLAKTARKLGDEPADEELHALRTRAKRARYAAELAEAGHSSKAFSRYLTAVKGLQDVIGEHQDAVVAEAKLRAIARERTAIAAGRLIERERERRRERRRRYPEVLAKVLRRGSDALA
jgi:CHAD domain-containing protein